MKIIHMDFEYVNKDNQFSVLFWRSVYLNFSIFESCLIEIFIISRCLLHKKFNVGALNLIL